MEFEERGIPEGTEDESNQLPKAENSQKINQTQFFDLITGEEVSWQAILYDLVKTEQLDPWDIDLVILADKYIEVIGKLEEADFFVSSKVLFACSLLLRLKSEILLTNSIQSLEELLYGKKEPKKYEYERIEIDSEELPILVPKTPLPRYRKVTLTELMSALNQAIETEGRRIKKEIKLKQAEKSALVVMPRLDRISLKDRIREIYSRIKGHISHPDIKEMPFSVLAPTKEEKLSAFLPVLHLTNQERLYLKQENHFEEIFMMLERFEHEMFQDLEELREEFPEDSSNEAYEMLDEGIEEDESKVREELVENEFD